MKLTIQCQCGKKNCNIKFSIDKPPKGTLFWISISDDHGAINNIAIEKGKLKSTMTELLKMLST